MMKKTIRVILSEEATKQYEELNKIVGDEIKKGVTNSIHQQLLKSINQKKELLKINPQAGIHISKKLIPKVYIDKYDADNLWKIDLSGYWRMIYTLRTTEIEITNFFSTSWTTKHMTRYSAIKRNEHRLAAKAILNVKS